MSWRWGTVAGAIVAGLASFVASPSGRDVRRQRARWRGRWLRIRRWEYWPSWMVYVAIVPGLVARSRRFGGLRTATCVNPAIELGGLVGESKSGILVQLDRHPAIARWARVEEGPLEARVAAAEDFAAGLQARWPLVVKPDRGERGVGVHIVHDRPGCERALRAVQIPAIVQEYVPGAEYGVFWVRRRQDAPGELLSVSRKLPVAVTGDGRRTLEELICGHARLVPNLDLHLERHRARLETVPADGEEVEVTELGTHARGATFLDSRHLATGALTGLLDSIMEGSGFDFGRFDLRVSCEEDLVSGRNVKVIEFNGLSSECAHIYDPAMALRSARSDLARQWALALEIGWRNRERGRRPATWGEILRAIHAHRRDRRRRGG